MGRVEEENILEMRVKEEYRGKEGRIEGKEENILEKKVKEGEEKQGHRVNEGGA